MSIQRYRLDEKICLAKHDQGGLVMYSDHEAAVREAVAEAVAQERAKAVAWLRAEAAHTPSAVVALRYAATVIERGEHAKETE